jgi:hypothetical protein
VICIPCRSQAHDLCDNGPENPHGTWCDCQHRAPVHLTTMSEEEYTAALEDLAVLRRMQKERRALGPAL